MADKPKDESPADGEDPENASEFTEFERLTRGLLKVPKDELDAKVAAHKNGAKTASRSTPRK